VSAVRRFRGDRRGSVAVMTALGATVLLGAAAIGVDLGMLHQASRKAQGAADVAALVAATEIGAAEDRARRSLADNGYGTSAVRIESGRYEANATLAPEARFRAADTPANAVRIDLSTTARTYFARALGLPAEVGIRARGTAARAQFAAFHVGSGLAALDGGIANAVLGALLDTRLSLRAMDYDALLSTRVDAFRFLDALDARLNLKAGSYAEVLGARASVGQVLSALQVAVAGEARAGVALAALSAALPGAGASLPVGRILDLGDAAALSPARGSRGPEMSLMDLVAATASVANGQRQISVDLGATVPGLTSTRLTLAIGERRQNSGWVQPGTPNATLRTAQTRLLIEAGLAAPLGLADLNLSLYAEAASAQASLRSVTCPWTSPSQRQVSVDAQTGVLTLALADVSRSALRAAGAGPDLSQPSEILRAPGLSIRAAGRTSLGGSYARTLTFGDDDITRHRVQSVSASGLVGSATAGLMRDATFDINGIGLSPLLRPALATTLAAAAPVLDQLLDSTLRTLGIRVGLAEVGVDGTRCDQAVLVQ